VLAFFLDYKKRLLEDFSAIFGEGGGRKTVASEWGWYHILSQMADNDLEKIERLTSKPITQVLFHLSYINDLNLSNGNV
jgi:hypothetical protein